MFNPRDVLPQPPWEGPPIPKIFTNGELRDPFEMAIPVGGAEWTVWEGELVNWVDGSKPPDPVKEWMAISRRPGRKYQVDIENIPGFSERVWTLIRTGKYRIVHMLVSEDWQLVGNLYETTKETSLVGWLMAAYRRRIGYVGKQILGTTVIEPIVPADLVIKQVAFPEKMPFQELEHILGDIFGILPVAP